MLLQSDTLDTNKSLELLTNYFYLFILIDFMGIYISANPSKLILCQALWYYLHLSS